MTGGELPQMGNLENAGSSEEGASNPFGWLKNVADYFGAPNQTLQELSDSAACGGLGVGIPITLFLQGGLLAGHIESAQDFYRAQGDIFRQGVANARSGNEVPEWADSFADMVFGSAANEIDAAIEADTEAYNKDGTKSPRMALTRNIFLTNVRYTVPGSASFPLEHAAIKLADVVGWTLGLASAT